VLARIFESGWDLEVMIKLKAPEEIEIMRAASIIVAEVLAELKGMVRPGITTDDLDRVAETDAQEGAVPAFRATRLAIACFPPHSAHPSTTRSCTDPVGQPCLREGDIIGLDFGVRYRGFYGDAAVTVAVGAVSAERRSSCKRRVRPLEAGIEEARPGRRIGDVSAAIQAHAERRNFAVVRDFVGHGIGRRLHENRRCRTSVRPIVEFGCARAWCWPSSRC